MKNKQFTRRDFIKTSSTAAAGTFIFSIPGTWTFGGQDKSRVVLIRNEDVLDDLNHTRETVVQEMLDQAVAALLGESDPVRAWKQLVSAEDIVGIKTNIWRYLPTPPTLEMAIKRRLMDAGVEEKGIGIRDQGLLQDALFKKATALINVRPIRTHHWSGVGSLIKNYIMFVRRPSDYPPDSCADLATIWKLPHVEGKTRLNILVLFTPLFHGIGPHHFNPQYTWQYKGLLVGIDPVAVDAVGVRILQAKRRLVFGEERPLNPPPIHIFLADTRHHLGTADPQKIELIKLGWQKDALI